MSSPRSWTRVIVLTPPPEPSHGSRLNDALRAEFAANDWYAIEQHHPLDAMAELCLRERLQASRAAWGLQRIEEIALVIHEPDHWNANEVRDLVAAVQRYLPAAAIWRADDERLHELHHSERSGVAAAKSAAAPDMGLRGPNGIHDGSPSHVTSSPPAPLDFRLRVNDKRDTATIQGEQHQQPDSRITRQEIHMLLDDDEAAMPSSIRGALP